MGVKENWEKAALAEELNALSLDMDGVSDKIGSTADTGGSTTAGTLMAKVNLLAAKVNSLESEISTLQSSVGSLPHAKTRDFGFFRQTVTVSAKTKTSVKTIFGKGRAALNFGTSGFVYLMIDNKEKNLGNNPCDSFSQIEVEFESNLSIAFENTSAQQYGCYYSLFYQLE